MDVVIYIFSAVLIFVGIIGCFLPILPGPPISYLGLLTMQLTEPEPFSTDFLLTMAVITAGVFVLDYIIPAYGTKKYGGSRAGVIGTFIGLFAGLILFPPFGIIIGPLVGALIGELTVGKDRKSAMRAAFGSFIGFLVGTLLKLSLCFVMLYYFFVEVF